MSSCALAQAYRLLWIYVAIHELARTTHIKAHNRQWPADWHDAAVRIATGPTPLLVVGGEMDVDQVEAGAVPPPPVYIACL